MLAPIAAAGASSVAAARGNRPPIAVDDSLDPAGIVKSINVLANDRDEDGDVIRLIDVDAANGTVAFTADGLLIYLPDPNTGGANKIFYTIADDRGGVAIGAIRLQKN